MKRLPKVATEMALHVLAYNLTRVMNIMGIQPLTVALRSCRSSKKAAHIATRLIPGLCWPLATSARIRSRPVSYLLGSDRSR
jgi:hypothetical protein